MELKITTSGGGLDVGVFYITEEQKQEIESKDEHDWDEWVGSQPDLLLDWWSIVCLPIYEIDRDGIFEVEFGDERFDIPTDSPPHRRNRGDFYLNFGNHQDREYVLTIWCFGKGGSSWSVDDERIKDFDYKLLEVMYDKVPGYLMNYRDGDRYITGITYDGIDLDGDGPDTGGCSIEYHITKREE